MFWRRVSFFPHKMYIFSIYNSLLSPFSSPYLFIYAIIIQFSVEMLVNDNCFTAKSWLCSSCSCDCEAIIESNVIVYVCVLYDSYKSDYFIQLFQSGVVSGYYFVTYTIHERLMLWMLDFSLLWAFISLSRWLWERMDDEKIQIIKFSSS